MNGIEARIVRLEERATSKRRPQLPSARRKELTDRAVLHGDQGALRELDRCRSIERPTGSAEQRAAAIDAAMRADR